MNTLLADPPAAPSSEQPPASGLPSLSPEGGQDLPRGGLCAHCGAPLQEGQQWCLQCGACEPGTLGERPNNWRALGALALVAAILAAGAAVAVAAAFNGHSSAPRAATVALAPAVTSTAPAASVPTTGLPPAPGKSGAAKTGAGSSSKGSANSLLFPPSSTGKPPKVPAPTATPESTGGSTGESSSGSSGESTTPTSTKTTETGASTTESKSKGEPSTSEPILLDTNSASTYNPYGYPEAGFGDPALAIDGESSTAWTAQVQAHSFPNLAEGLLIDLRSSTKLSSVELRTPTHGMTVQVYGANGAKAPATITTPGWTQLSSTHVLKKTVTHLKLHAKGRAFRWLVVWIVKVPAASQGTPQAPGHVALSEVALYPPSS